MAKKADGTDNFEEHIINSFKGYYSSIDPTNYTPSNPHTSILVRGSQNVYKKLSGTIANRPGRKQYDAVDSTLAGVKSAYVWYTSKGATLPLRVANSLFQVYSTITGTGVWYTLQSSVTLTRYIFDTVWDGTLLKDFLVFVRGSTDLFRWDGGIGLFSSGTVNTIVLTADAANSGFPTSGGTVTINGNTYTYSGISGSTLTGVNVDSSAEAVNSVVLLSVVTNATTPASTFTNDFVRVNNNHLGIGSNTSRKFYISKDTNYIDYSQSTPRLSGEGAQPFFDDNLVGAIVKDGDYWISAGNSDWYQVKFVQSVNSSGVTVEALDIAKQPVPSLAGAYSHEFITVVNNTIVYLSKDQQLRTIGLYRNLNQPAYPALSQEIFDELSEEDFTGGHIKAINDFIYLVAPNSSKVYLHQTRSNVDPSGNVISERLWHSPFVWGLSRIDEINGTVVGFSNSNPQLYSLWGTGQWHDDDAAADTTTYDTGATNPGTVTDNATVGTVPWSDPSNAIANDTTYATAVLGSSTTSHYAKAANFGFAIPSNATIVGILVEIEKKSDMLDVTRFIKDNSVKIVKSNGAFGSTDKADTSTKWPTTEAYASYGSSSDLWGETWTPADINNSNFGVGISANGFTSAASPTASIDHIRITVYYTYSSVALAYTSIMLLAYQNGGRRQGKINFDKMYYEGYLAGNLYEAVYYDYQGAEDLQTSVINNTDEPLTSNQLFTGVLPPSLGDVSLGDNPLGSGLNTLPDDQATLPKFRIIVGKGQVDCFEFAPMVYSNEVDSRWEIIALGANYGLAFAQAIEIIKS